MNKRPTGLVTVFSILLTTTVVGILLHYVSSYHYPASPAMDFEMNVLGDPYELFMVIPIGCWGLWLLRKRSVWGPLVMSGVSIHFAYNYALFLTGQHNLWVFFWIAKLALSGVALCLLWSFLPIAPSGQTKPRLAAASYFAFVLLIFSKMMGERLIASATGHTMDMTMQAAGVLDWSEPFLRDPIIFFSFAFPMVLTAIIGLWRGMDWGGKAAAMSATFIISIVTVVLFTGPLKEYLQQGSVSVAMWTMSVIMVMAAAPAIWTLKWLTQGQKYTASTKPTFRA